MPKSKDALSTVLHLHVTHTYPNSSLPTVSIADTTGLAAHCTGTCRSSPLTLWRSFFLKAKVAWFLLLLVLVSPVVEVAGVRVRSGRGSTPNHCHQKHAPLGSIPSSLTDVAEGTSASYSGFTALPPPADPAYCSHLSRQGS